MARHNFPDLIFEVVQHDRSWAIWLVVILGGVVGVFAPYGADRQPHSRLRLANFPDNGEVGRKSTADRAISRALHLRRRHQRFTRRFARYC